MGKRLFLLMFFLTFVIDACGSSATLVQPTIVIETSSPTLSTLPTATQRPSTPTKIIDTKVPTLTTTPGPIIDAEGNISWHPQEVLIAAEEGGGDGVAFDYPPNFVLLWDGTLLQQGENYLGPPFVSHLDQDEMCKILNTVDASGFFEEPGSYNFPFDGLGSQHVSVNAWKSNSSGAQIFDYALSGAPYYDGLFCRNCPIPSEQTIIRPGLANVHFLLRSYVSENREIAPVDKLEVYFIPVDQEPTHDWPITSISPAELSEKCEQTYCYDAGMILEGPVIEEIIEKIRSNQVFVVAPIFNSIPFRVRYRVVWPYEPSIMYYSGREESQARKPPVDYVLTCNSAYGKYPVLPLSNENKFWYYAPDGKWGAEVVDKTSEFIKIRLVNKTGYEKFYQYDPALFGQLSLKVFPRFWTNDGEYFFVNVLPGDFDVLETPLVNSIGLQTVSIGDGKVSYIFAGVEGHQYAYVLSEDGRQVVYIRQGDQPLKIVLKDTYSGKEQAASLAIPLNGMGIYETAGTLIWSTNEKTVYFAAIYSENNVKSGRLIAVDLSNLADQKIIYESTKTFKLNQRTIYDENVGICPLTASVEDYCSTQLNLEDGTVNQN
jgi:hypothetical protein